MAITQSSQGEMLSRCREVVEKDLPMLKVEWEWSEDGRLQQKNTQKVPQETPTTLSGSGHLGLRSVVLVPACRSQQQVEAEPGI